MKERIIVSDKESLELIINKEITQYGNNCDLNHIDISNLTDLSDLFGYSDFNGDISKWNTSNITNMNELFINSKFNGDISKWDVSNVLFMADLFYGSDFKGDISAWRPLKLDHITRICLGEAIIPYWAKYDMPEDRVKAIESYDLFNKISKDLNDNDFKVKKNKI